MLRFEGAVSLDISDNELNLHTQRWENTHWYSWYEGCNIQLGYSEIKKLYSEPRKR